MRTEISHRPEAFLVIPFAASVIPARLTAL
jgi:hypothetical protein